MSSSTWRVLSGYATYQRTPMRMTSGGKWAPLKLIAIVLLPHDGPLVMEGDHTAKGLKGKLATKPPILQWGIKKDDAQSFSVQEERTTPPRRGGRSARHEGTRGKERNDDGPGPEEDGSACSRARGAVPFACQHAPAPRGSRGWAGAREREAGRASADDRPPAAGQRDHSTTWLHPVHVAT